MLAECNCHDMTRQRGSRRFAVPPVSSLGQARALYPEGPIHIRRNTNVRLTMCGENAALTDLPPTGRPALADASTLVALCGPGHGLHEAGVRARIGRHQGGAPRGRRSPRYFSRVAA